MSDKSKKLMNNDHRHTHSAATQQLAPTHTHWADTASLSPISHKYMTSDIYKPIILKPLQWIFYTSWPLLPPNMSCRSVISQACSSLQLIKGHFRSVSQNFFYCRSAHVSMKVAKIPPRRPLQSRKRTAARGASPTLNFGLYCCLKWTVKIVSHEYINIF